MSRSALLKQFENEEVRRFYLTKDTFDTVAISVAFVSEIEAVSLAAVSDAGPLIHLAEIDSLELLEAFETLLVPETVYEEVEAGGVPGELADRSYELVEVEESHVESEELDAGERAAIAVAEERGIVLLSDDLAAREAASDAGIEVRVSIGASRSVTAANCSTETKRHRVCGHSSARRVAS